MEELNEIVTDNWILRRIEAEDANKIFEIFSNPEVIRYWDHVAWKDISEATRYIQDAHTGLAENRHFYWGVCKKGNDNIVGICALRDYSQDHKTIEILYALLPEYWAQGIASEVIPKVVEFGFDSLDLNRIHATTEPRNAASTRVLLNSGFKLEGRLRENWIYPGESPTDTNLLGLIKSEWIQSKT
ncbi:MAG: GNAT family N-acetyltransferase [Gammaproteobacteria bacterium]|nr:GNAT family N-acetyltransferase [Gammaproteobacteria bacterium]